MNIQWFPGHMHKARKEIAKRLTAVDLVIEVLDARIPYSSENPMLRELRGEKACIKILNKADLADARASAEWQSSFEKSDNLRTVAMSCKLEDDTSALVSTCKSLLPGKVGSLKGIQTLIVGIPNVGKSTLINQLCGKTIAKTGNEPAITKMQQRIDLNNGIVLFDTPGVLWPNVENRNSGFRLAATGAIKDTAMEYEEVALFTIDYLKEHYLDTLVARYQLSEPSHDSTEILESVGRARGCLGRGGSVDWQRAAKILIGDFRSGKLGPITLESPSMMMQEIIETDEIRAQKAAKKAERDEKRKSKKR